MTNTENYNLAKPAGNDYADIAVLNENMDKIDAALKGKAELAEDGKIPAEQLPEMDFAASSHADQHAADGDDPITPESIGAAEARHTHAASDIASGTLDVERGGTGATTFTSGAALIGAGTGAVTTRAITNNTSTSSAITGSTNLVTMNTLRYALNRATGIASADTNYTTAMMRAIKASTTDLTAGTSSLASGQIYLVYE